MTPRQQLLEEAIKITTSDRNNAYGKPEDNFRNIAGLWNAYWASKFGMDSCTKFTAADVAIMNMMIKVARLSTNPTHHDSALDIAGYAACLSDIQQSMKNQQEVPCVNQVTSTL